MSEPAERSATVERLQRRLAREKSARLQAEAITERVTSDRWELRQQLEHKLALRTSELEAARRTAAQALTDRQRYVAAMSHGLRTPLTALFFLAESLTEEEPLGAQRLEDLRNLLAKMRTVMDTQASASVPADTDNPPTAAKGGSESQMTLSDIISAHEGAWHQAAARSGKLLMLDIEIPSGRMPVGTADEVDKLVLGLIRDRLESSEAVIELHLRLGSDGLEGS